MIELSCVNLIAHFREHPAAAISISYVESGLKILLDILIFPNSSRC